MNEPNLIQSGEPISAARMNDILEYARPPYTMVPNEGNAFFGSKSANGRSGVERERTILVRAFEDFRMQQTSCSIVDDVPAGLVEYVRIIPQLNVHVPPSNQVPFFVHDPVAGLTGNATKSAGDYFHVTWNDDSGRWEVIGSPSDGTITAVVNGCLGDGWHEVEITDWDGIPNAHSDSLSASVSDEECNICNLIPEGYASSSVSASVSDILEGSCDSVNSFEVPRTAGTRTGETVYAHTTRLMPMLSGGLIKMKKRSSSSSSSQSASVSDAVITDRLYDVIEGVWPLMSLPFPVYECCEDPVTGVKAVKMVSCTHAVVEGYACAGQTNPCDTSGSASV